MDDAAQHVREMLGPAEPTEHDPPPHQVVVHPGGIYLSGSNNTVIVYALSSGTGPAGEGGGEGDG